MEVIANPKKSEDPKDLHVYVAQNIYDIVDKLVREGIVKTKTDYIAELIVRDLKERDLLK